MPSKKQIPSFGREQLVLVIAYSVLKYLIDLEILNFIENRQFGDLLIKSLCVACLRLSTGSSF